MQYKKIERPESTTYCVETWFHFIKDEKEFENCMTGVHYNNVLLYGRGITEQDCQPIILFVILPKHKEIQGALKYVACLEHIPEDHRELFSELITNDKR